MRKILIIIEQNKISISRSAMAVHSKLSVLFLALLTLSLFIAAKSSEKKEFPPITMTNFVEFYNSKFNNPLAGCAFLLQHGTDTLAITCKHALWVAKSDSMKTIGFGNYLKQWRMQRKDDTTQFILTDKLLNENYSELIGEENVHSDYLLFSIKENHSNITPLKIRTTEIKSGETLYLVGWSFMDKTGKQRIYKTKFYKKIENHILLETLDSNIAGMSGSPVVDENGLLVGIVSNFTFDKETNKWYYSPCSLDYLIKTLSQIRMK